MTLLYIVLATLAGGVLSVLTAALLTVQVLGRLVKHLVSLSVGVLLGTALLQVLPEAFEGSANTHALFLTLLLVPVMYAIFVLDLKLIRWEKEEDAGAAVDRAEVTVGTAAVS